jgi:hypothetical protein
MIVPAPSRCHDALVVLMVVLLVMVEVEVVVVLVVAVAVAVVVPVVEVVNVVVVDPGADPGADTGSGMGVVVVVLPCFALLASSCSFLKRLLCSIAAHVSNWYFVLCLLLTRAALCSLTRDLRSLAWFTELMVVVLVVEVVELLVVWGCNKRRRCSL